MAIADLLGVQFDMQLLVKMSISVGTMLLVSLAYRFYSSRNREESSVQDSQAPQTCLRCKTVLQGTGTDDESSLVDEPSSGSTKADDYATQELGNMAHSTQHTDKEVALVTSWDTSTDQPSLDLLDPKKNGLASSKGRRSPCLLKKLDGGTGVGRELRNDLEQHGVYSSFYSKAEVKVEDAKLVPESPEDQIVLGKIYEYYVESSSHFTTEPTSLLGKNEKKSESQEEHEGHRNMADSPSSAEPDVTEGSESVGNQKLMSSQGSVPVCKQSDLSAGSPLPPSVSSTSTDPLAVSPSTNNTCLSVNKGSDQGAGPVSPLVHLSAKNPDFETLKSQVDLGNCLEVLHFAKKNGQSSVEQAALRFMSNNYFQVLQDTNLYGRLTDASREQLQRQRTRGKRFIMVADMNPQDWSRNTGATRRMSSALYYYNDCVDAWQMLCPIPQEVISKACAMCTMDNYLFVAVGCQGTDSEMSPSKRVFCYNPLTDIWKEISPMNEARPRCKLAALDGHVYAIGGECLSSVERYDPRLDRWTFVAPLPNDTFAVAHHVTVCNGELFVSGGSLRCMLLRYSPKTDTWRGSLLASGKDRIVDMVAVGSFLYRFEVNSHLGVSVYRYHTVARLWYECATKRLAHCPAFQCVAMDDCVYCVSRHFTLKFEADEVSPAFADDNFSVPPAAKGLLVPFVLSLPDKRPLQTSV
uniref:kelch domain-containing protein 7A n=1 Tax=Doryrhamphus excisus TaxID=161450 RepID=UPI0025ADA82E|nr:kelch domain-containing protein 7A [Doryrhamphus excisus]